MKLAISRFLIVAAIAALVVMGSTAASAQCPASPNYKTDFSSELTPPQCLTLNVNATIGVPASSLPVPPLPVPSPNPPQAAPAGVAHVLRLTPAATGQIGSAWFNTQQPVSGQFSTTFKFQLSGANTFNCGGPPTAPCPADGFAFVIQNSALTAFGPDGCGIGFGQSTDCTSNSGGITNSLAVEFDTYKNGGDPSGNHVAIQNCGGASANSSDPSCRIADNSNLKNASNQAILLADGNIHTVTISYTPPPASMVCASTCPGTLDVILDNTDLFPAGVLFDMTSITLNGGNASVGFTAATGGADDNQDILNWTFQPTSQSVVVTSANQSTVPFQNANQSPVYDYTLQLNTGTIGATIKPKLMTVAACNAIVQRNFWPAHCFVFQDAEGSGMDAAVMFEVTCQQTGSGTCSGVNFSELGTDFTYTNADNPLFVWPGVLGLLNPFPGWLRGDGGPDPLNPCTPPTTGALFQSNQIASFQVVGDPGGTTKGRSPSGASCWVPTYDTPGEALPGIKITLPKLLATYGLTPPAPQVLATYTCSDPSTSKPTSSNKGPYLTVASCNQSELIRPGFTANSCTAAPGVLNCTGVLDTTVKGLHTFVVTAIDSGGNTNVNAVVYNVK